MTDGGKGGPGRIAAPALWLLLLCPASQALAYVDPGTGPVVFSGLGYLLALGGAALLFFLRPVIRLFKRIKGIFLKKNNVDET